MRNRTKYGNPQQVYARRWYESYDSTFTYFCEEDFISDIPGLPKSGKPLLHRKYRNAALFSGSSPSGSSFKNFPMTLFANTRPPRTLYQDHNQALAECTRLLATLSPSGRAGLAINNIAELPQIVSLFQDQGTNFLSSFGSNYLRQDFGWNNLVRDLWELYDSAYEVDRYVRRLVEGKGSLTGKFKLPRVVSSQKRFDVVHSDGALIEGEVLSRESLVTTIFGKLEPGGSMKTVWGDVPIPPISPDQLADGLRASPVTLWEAIPFSWLVDWAVPVGDYLKATDGMCGFHVSESWYATEHTSIEELITPLGRYERSSAALYDLEFPGHKLVTYERVPVTPGIVPSIPFVSLRRAGTLTALLAKFLGR